MQSLHAQRAGVPWLRCPLPESHTAEVARLQTISGRVFERCATLLFELLVLLLHFIQCGHRPGFMTVDNAGAVFSGINPVNTREAKRAVHSMAFTLDSWPPCNIVQFRGSVHPSSGARGFRHFQGSPPCAPAVCRGACSRHILLPSERLCRRPCGGRLACCRDARAPLPEPALAAAPSPWRARYTQGPKKSWSFGARKESQRNTALGRRGCTLSRARAAPSTRPLRAPQPHGSASYSSATYARRFGPDFETAGAWHIPRDKMKTWFNGGDKLDQASSQQRVRCMSGAQPKFCLERGEAGQHEGRTAAHWKHAAFYNYTVCHTRQQTGDPRAVRRRPSGRRQRPPRQLAGVYERPRRAGGHRANGSVQ